MTNKEMMNEMLARLDLQVCSIKSNVRVIDALDRDGACDLNDQLVTADALIQQITDLVFRMKSINNPNLGE